MKKLMFATALVASAAAFADPINAISFEGYTAGDTFVNGAAEKDETGTVKTPDGPYFYFQGEQDGSSVKAFGGENAAEPNITRPTAFANASDNDNYLDLSTEGGILWRSINNIIQGGTEEAPTHSLGTEKDIAATGTYLDTLVQFTPTEDGGTPEITSDDKLAIWLNVSENVTNLMVRAGYVDDNGTATETVATNYVLSTASPVVAGQWYRLTIKAIADVTECRKRNSENNNGKGITGFEIYLDGTLLQATSAPFAQGYIDRATDATEFGWLDQTTDADFITYLQSGKVFPSLRGELTSDTIQAVGFKGSGALDDIVWTDEAPSFEAAGIDFTLTWPSGVTPVSYTIDGGTPVLIDGNTTFPIQVADGAVVAFTFTNADGATKTMTATASSSVNEIDAEDAVYVWADYLGDAVNGAYTIDDANDLDMLRKGVASGLATANETFKQTDDIDMTSAGAFAGVGTYAKIPTSGTPFLGTYDGQNHMIANVQRAGNDTQGIFNQVGPSGVIENLVVSNMYWDAALTGEYGLAIVGNAGGGATLRNLTAAGTFGSASKPSTHNIAGIVVRLSPGATAGEATTVDSCTNNATIYGGYTKLGGINAIVQDQTGFKNGKVVFVNCANNGTLVCKRTAAQVAQSNGAVTGQAGIVGYFSGTNVELTNCYGNGVIVSEDGANTDKNGALIGWTYGGTVTDNGGNSAPADKKMIGTWGSATETGFLYATVANGVATTLPPPYTLTAGRTYLLEGNVAASETPVFTLTADGDTIAFDTALGYTFAGTVDGASTVVVTDATAGSVTTYTAALAVAQVNSGTKYATLQAAVDAATAGDTVTVLADCTISGTPLSIAKNLTIHNDHTITGAVNYAICIGATVSFEGSGKIERASGITGSAFCVGANETTRGAITQGTAGTLNFTGLTVCGGSGGNLIKLENGTVTMNGGVLKDGKRGIKADADAGSYTSAIVINGGTITNNTDCAVMASAESATGTATVTINGGVIAGALTIDKTAGTCSITIPGTSTAMFNADQSTFCESGYETTDGDNDGWFTVSAIQSSGGYKVVIENSDVAITPQAGDLEALAAAGVNTNSVDAVNAALATPIEGTGTPGIPAWQALFLGVAPTTNGLETVAIKSIGFDEDGKVEIEMADGVTLKTGRGVDIKLKLMGSTDLTNWTQIGSDITNTKTIPAVTPAQGETKKFYKVVVDFAGSSN